MANTHKMKELASNLADEFLLTRETDLIWSWGIKENPDIEVVVVVVRRRKSRSERTKAAVGLSGKPCPTCDGTGRI